ncbi:MAG: RDD family protein [Rhodobacteraceae bacterium]|nr:RDD family protein [Paracoccaceae bacterium]
MISTTQTYAHQPDPVMQPEFYADVTVKRGLAWVIDTVLITFLILPVLLMTAFIGLFFLPLLYLIVGFGYRWISLSGHSATPGMRLMAIEFRDSNGHRFDGSLALLHTLGYTLSMAVPFVQLVSIVLMFVTARGQGLTDHVLGTVALNRRAG